MDYIPLLLAIALVLVVVALFFMRSIPGYKILIVSLVILVSLELGVCSFICWFLRDGMGPGAITSSGQLAWDRFWPDMVPALIFLGIISATGCLGAFVSRKRMRARKNEVKQPVQDGLG